MHIVAHLRQFPDFLKKSECHTDSAETASLLNLITDRRVLPQHHPPTEQLPADLFLVKAVLKNKFLLENHIERTNVLDTYQHNILVIRGQKKPY